MAKRSLKASSVGVVKAKQAFERTGWTQEYLAAEVGLSTRQPVWKFFTGRPVARSVFQEICFRLNLTWEEIAERSERATAETAPAPSLTTDLGVAELVPALRGCLQERLQARCSTVTASFEAAQPLPLVQVYTEPQVRIRPNQQRWLDVDDLNARIPRRDRPSLGDEPYEETQPARALADRCVHLAILGKPGAGKTTLLQHLALECIAGRYRGDCVPVWIDLRTLATGEKSSDGPPHLLDFLADSLGDCFAADSLSVCGINRACLEVLARAGKLLLLLDGLDEVSRESALAVADRVQAFVGTYPQAPVLLTCRSGLQEYHFHNFTYVEIANFGPPQIASFAERWFAATAASAERAAAQAEAFLTQLERRKNRPIQELATTPLLLGLICAVFQERSAFPRKRSRLYQTGLDILLVRWDRSRGVRRDCAYYNLPLANKIGMLSQIAWQACERGEYFFEKNELVQAIGDYLTSLAGAPSGQSNEDLETVWLESEAALHAIVVQHGLLVERAREIYSFSHVTFQEYLAARRVAALADPAVLVRTLETLAERIDEPQWCEVVGLTASMLPDAGEFCQRIATHINLKLGNSSEIQAILQQIQAKVAKIETSEHSQAAMRAFYLSFYLDRDLSLAVTLDANIATNPAPELALDLALLRILSVASTLVGKTDMARARSQVLDLHFSLDLGGRFELSGAVAEQLQNLRETLVRPDLAPAEILQWWQAEGVLWQEALLSVLQTLRGLPDPLALAVECREQLRTYAYANRFLCDCLNGDAQVSDRVREALKNDLLLAQSSAPQV